MKVVAVGTFILVLALVLGIYGLFVVRPERREKAALKERLTPKAPKKKRRLLTAASEQEEQAGGRVLGKIFAPVRRQLARAGVKFSLVAFLIASVWLGGLTCVLVWVGSGWPPAGLFAGAGAACLPYMYVMYLGAKRTWKFEELFPEAIDLVSRAIRSGHALPAALGMVASEVPHPVGTEFRTLYDQQNFGMSLPDALRGFASRVPILDARFFVTALLTQRESGGNLAGVLDNLAAVIRDRFKVKRQVKVISAHGRMTAMILSALPPVLALIISCITPTGMMTFVKDPIGQKMIIGAVVLQIVGMLIMRKIVRVEF